MDGIDPPDYLSAANSVTQAPRILIVAGEASGDLHGAPVVAAIRKLQPEARFFGAGGWLMRQEGVETLAGVEELAVMGFTGLPKVLPRLARLKKQLLKVVEAERVPLAILIDYPGFNLNLAESLKKLPHPPKILYYVAPQLWAWRQSRAKFLRRYVDRLAVVFSFEIEFFRKLGITPDFVGHPLLDEISPYIARTADKNEQMPLLALLPGSRPSVAKRHLPLMVEAAKILTKTIPNLRIGAGRASILHDWKIWDDIENEGVTIWNDSRELLLNSNIAAVCSGTATLEAALLGVPQVVVYKTSTLNYRIARSFVKTPNVALANLTSGRTIVTELIQNGFTAGTLAAELERILFDNEVRSSIIAGYSDVRKALGEPGAADRVAQLAKQLLDAYRD